MHRPLSRQSTLAVVATLAVLAGMTCVPLTLVHANGGGSAKPIASGSSNQKNTDSITVTKAYTNATATTGGELLIKAASSDASARLFAYRPDGSLIGELQNGGGGRYGGTVMPYQSSDPIKVTIRSSMGGSITVPTTPFQI